jgi:hypothetical protein
MTGTTISVSSVDVMTPPIIAAVVIRIGRRRTWPAVSENGSAAMIATGCVKPANCDARIR